MLDETEGKQNKEQTESSATSSGSQDGSTSKTTRDDSTQKQISDALAKAGRTAAALQRQADALKARETALEQREREREQAERDELKDDPERLSAYDMRLQAKRDKDAAARVLEEAKAEREANAADRAEVDQNKFIGELYVLSQEFEGGDLGKLQGFATRGGLTKLDSLPAIRAYAEDLWKKKGTEAPQTRVDSGANRGNAGKLTPEAVSKMSPDEKFARRKEIAELMKTFT